MGLLLQILVFLIVAAALGFAVGWLVRGARLPAEGAGLEAGGQRAAAEVATSARVRELQDELARAQTVNARHQAEVGRLEARIAELEASMAAPATLAGPAGGAHPGVAEAAVAPPPALAGPEGLPDDLQQISGIGPGIEKTLHELGIFHFRQIAAFTPENVAWVNRRLRFRGRIEREDWIGQARRLAAGGAPL